MQKSFVESVAAAFTALTGAAAGVGAGVTSIGCFGGTILLTVGAVLLALLAAGIMCGVPILLIGMLL